MALRIADLAKTLGLQHTPWLLTALAADGPTVFLIPEIRALLSMPGVAASRLGHTEGGLAGRTTLMGNVGFLDVPRIAARTPAGADSGENYFSSGCAPQLDDWWFSTVKAILTENPAEFSASGSPVQQSSLAFSTQPNCAESSWTRKNYGISLTASLSQD